MEPINDSPSANSENNQHSDCLVDSTTENSADSISALNSPSPSTSNNNLNRCEERVLKCPLTETVYLSIRQGLEINCHKYCLRLKKALYGLKETPLAWYNHLKDWLQRIGFNTCKLDPCVFDQKEPDALCIYVHMDDVAIFGTNIKLFKEKITKELNIKDIGPAELLLGVKTEKLDECIMLTQQHFVDSLLDLYGMKNCKTVSTPLVSNEYLLPATDDKRRTFEEMGINFRSAVGSIVSLEVYFTYPNRPQLS
ncbi:hypothetical protein O181_112254 [Austropuccinia psidii MF-1]|uniref:Reverse transcriptase Ty1/copia-type domain-containing protein n=1 Tax=Austropuccinia psidii MF-1 TaxID=1389203 RepID=A0A9Q3PSK3_9BASI|nr:hypothetical protein [Austropuccinia psidii MF-1]